MIGLNLVASMQVPTARRDLGLCFYSLGELVQGAAVPLGKPFYGWTIYIMIAGMTTSKREAGNNFTIIPSTLSPSHYLSFSESIGARFFFHEKVSSIRGLSRSLYSMIRVVGFAENLTCWWVEIHTNQMRSHRYNVQL
jgi:hypothetical protein